MTDSLGQMIARKLETEGWLRAPWDSNELDSGVSVVAALIDYELAREREEAMPRCQKCNVEMYALPATIHCPICEPPTESWVSVKERLPEKGKRVLVYFANVLAGPYFDVWEFSGANQYFAAEPSCNPKEDVTHWQPLPAPPACGS